MGYHKGPAENLVSQSSGTEVGEQAAGARRTHGGGETDLWRSDITKCPKAWPGTNMAITFGFTGSVSDQREEKS